MSAAHPAGHDPRRSPRLLVPVLGIAQILAWGSSYYLLAVLARPIAADTGWSFSWIVAGLSLGLLAAGLVAPRIGQVIKAQGGRPVLIAGSLLFATGLLIMSLAPNIGVFLASWVIMGFGMAAGLYDSAFSTLGRLYGHGARNLITALTLFGGFASTLGWPLAAFFVESFGWRGACLCFAGIHLCITLPLHLFAVPKEITARAVETEPAGSNEAPTQAPPRSLFILMALTTLLSAFLSTVISVHLLTMLQADGISLAAAVAFGALVGPSQVGARFIESLIGKYHHPIWTKLASVICVGLGLGLLWAGLPLVAVTLVLYGAGIGLESIARATLPLSFFGPADYAPIMGRLARPSLFAQAAAPSIGAFLIEHGSPETALGAVVIGAVLNVALAVGLWMMTQRGCASVTPN
ncbi:MAG: MFS transporter [Proteobacteria bacterium]|nr:MFS transporter [Pseudomonadota bacterium]